MKKLKGLLSANGLKALFVDHGEKIGFGVIGLVVLLILSGSRWLPVPGTPQDILNAVEKGRNAITANNWTPAQGEKFALVDFVQEVSRLRQPPNVQEFEFSTPLFTPLYRKQELAKEPELLPVESLIATADRVILGKSPAPVGGDETMAEGGAVDGANPALAFPGTAPASNEDQRFAPRVGVGAAATGFPGAGFPGAAGAHGGAGTLSGGTGVMPPGQGAMPGAAHGGPGGMMSGEMYGGMGMGGGSGKEPDGKLLIAVRGVWPVKEQLVKIQRALNLQSLNEASAKLNLIDFHLERQMAVAGTDPWTAPWETVNVQTAMEVLDQAADYEEDPVPPDIQDPVITCPLPSRLQGKWLDLATHPRIKSFQLSPEEMAKEEAFLATLREEYEKTLAANGPARPSAKGFAAAKGFSSRSNNYRGMASMVMDYAAEDSNYGNEMYSGMGRGMSGMMPGMPGAGMGMPGGGVGMPGSAPMKPEDVKKRLQSMTAAGTFLLFRYFDFDVRPGMAYRYRVKLKIENPNWERPPETLVDPAIALGETRETPESNISNPAVVPDKVNYFVKDVKRDPMEEALGNASKRALAVLQMFEWDSDFGTVNADSINLTTLGQFIGETKKSLRLDVSKPTFKTDDVKFWSEDVFLDANSDLELNPASHPDLKLGPRGHVGVPGEILVATESGELKVLDPTTRQNRWADLDAFVTGQRKPYEEIKDKEDAPKGGLDPLGDYPGAAMSPEMMMGMPGMGVPGQKPNKKPGRGGRRGDR
jgi:hypothetical protein